VTRLRDEGMTAEETLARNLQVKALFDHAGYSHVTAALEARRLELERKILDGNLEIDAYRSYSGELKGIVYALETPLRLIRQAPEGGPDAT